MGMNKEDDAKAKYMADCGCGSGKPNGQCCGAGDACPCGSGKTVAECCFKSPETH
jgi:uncharacterized protein YecA (UPF0149 family)